MVSGLRNKAGEGGVPHENVQETWLNCVHPRQRNAETGVGVTADQVAARHLQKDTTLPSMELCGEPGGMISFRTPDQPLPLEGNPRKVFTSMFGQGQTKEERQAILGTTTQPARLRDGVHGQPQPQARCGRSGQGQRLTSIRSARSSFGCRGSQKAANR